jgi:hypothetical protein
VDHRLRPGPPAGGPDADPERGAAGDTALHEPGAGRGLAAAGGCPDRRVQPGGHALRAVDAAAGLRRPDAAGGGQPDPGARAAGAAPAQPTGAARPGDDRPEGDGQAAGGPLRHGPGSGRRPAPLFGGQADPGPAGGPGGKAAALVPAEPGCRRPGGDSGLDAACGHGGFNPFCIRRGGAT